MKRADSVWLAGAILIAAALSVYAAFWPGLIDLDSSRILAQARSGGVTDWWTGLGTLLLRDWLNLKLSIGLLWAGCVAANILGFYGVARGALRRAPAALTALGATLFPPIYGELASFSRDTAFMGFVLLAFAALAQSTRGEGAARRNWLIGAFSAAVMASVCRQNGAVMVGAVGAFIVLQRGSGRARRTALAVLVAIGLAAGCYASIGVVQRAEGVQPSYATRATMDYDLAAMSIESGHDFFPTAALRALGPGTVTPAQTSLRWLQHQFDPSDETSLLEDKAVNYRDSRLAAAENAVLSRAWKNAVIDHPLAYLAERTRLTGLTLGLDGAAPAGMNGLLDYSGLSNPTNYGNPLASVGRYRVANAWLHRFIGPQARLPLDRGWCYLLIICILGTVAAVRDGRTRALVGSLFLAALLNQAFLYFAAPAASFRYVMILPPFALLSAVLAAAASARRPVERGLGVDRPESQSSARTASPSRLKEVLPIRVASFLSVNVHVRHRT